MSFAKIAAMALCASVVTVSSWADDKGHKREQMREQMHEPAGYGASQERGRNMRHEDDQPGNRARQPGSSGARFGERHRESVRDYFEPRVRAGRCPPGLAKKNNGCLPPGQAKQWIMGQPLPRELVRYPLPVELRRQLGRAPAGYEYVRVDNDILMLIIGTGMVVDAIENLGGF